MQQILKNVILHLFYHINIKNSDLSKLLNGVKLEIKENNDLYNIYCDNKYIGIGEVVNNKLKRKIII